MVVELQLERVIDVNFNFHSHTARCMHAFGNDEDYVKAAIEAGFEEIGFSDHSPWPFGNGYVSPMRMGVQELESYALSVMRLREKYKNKIKIRLGLECEYFEQHIPWLCACCEKYGIEYLLLGNHFTPDEENGIYNGRIKTPQQLESYKNHVLRALDSGLFLYLAHPDIFMRSYGEFDSYCAEASRQIIEKAIETGTPIEYNLLGFENTAADGAKEGYPRDDFWKIAGSLGAPAVIGLDAHNPESYIKKKELFEKSELLLKEYGVQLVYPFGRN